MQQTITYLKLDPEERANQARMRAEDNVNVTKSLVDEIQAATCEILDQRNKVLAEVQDAFNHLQAALAEREQHLIDEVNRISDQSISKYRALEKEAQEELKIAQEVEEEISKKHANDLTEADMNIKPCRLTVPVPEFNLKFLCNEEPAIAYLQKIGKVGKW
eukprot:CAMPEP_0204905950 /NCGR_PEP_ID=MMETSP1397-20131031/5713_1 /ASSEMBLY_ACC=CAM_ASM_000891 /TAXON_ID=49980 /ORGANISM="Climacostomum Climacostomum virens, Strain Stock W-24" /LENGTH=160 /DNA_ID=CAMNT_0052074903 /DNA_START=222 /DNA_END=701 /DNA_ORIENTATION=-